MIQCKDEAEMVSLIKAWLHINYPNSRLQDPDYISSNRYSPQWKAIGALGYWEFRGVVVAVKYNASYNVSFCFALPEPKPMAETNKQGVEENCPELDDLDAGTYDVSDLINRLTKVKALYGAETKIVFDAGSNNIFVSIIKPKKD